MSERMVEVEWDHGMAAHGWSTGVPEMPTEDQGIAKSVGYVVQDSERGLVLVSGLLSIGGWFNSGGQTFCAIFIPRLAIRNVWELRRKR